MVDSWRTRRAGQDPAAGPASWRKPAASRASSPYWQRRTGTSLFNRWQVKLGLLGCAAVGLIAFLVAMVLRWDVKVPVVALAVHGFDDPIPPNALAWEDVRRFEDVLGQHDNVDLTANADVTGTPAHFLSTLIESVRQVRPGGPEKDTIIIYLSAHGVVNERNEPCLVLDPSQAANPSTWLPVHELLKAVVEARRDRVRTVLLLDSGKLDHCWPLGIVYNAFAERLADLIEHNRTAYPRLAVINSNSAGQTCQLAPEIGGSVFGYVAAAALRGAAAGDDDVITLGELHNYMHSIVDRFAREHRSTRQQVQLLPSEPSEFSLNHEIVHATDQAEPAAHPIDVLARRPVISELWERFGALDSEDALRRDPVAWSLLRRKLLRLDMLLLAGQSYEDKWEWTVNEVRSLLNTLETSRAEAVLDLYSLASIRQSGASSADHLTQARKQFDEWAAAVSQLEPGAPLPPRPEFPYATVAELVWHDVLQSTPSRDSLLERLRWLPEGAAPLEGDYRELQYLRLLVQGLDWQQVNPTAVARSLSVLDTAERAAAPTDHRALYWISAQLAEADAAAREARDLLFVGSPDAIAKAEAIWNGGRTDYEQLIATAQRISHAYALRDQAWADAPYYAQWLLSSPSAAQDADLRKALVELIASSHELARGLDNAPSRVDGGQAMSQVDAAAQSVEQALNVLQSALQRNYRELWEERVNDHESLEQIGILLRLPLTPADIRIREDLSKRYFSERFAAGSITLDVTAEATTDDLPVIDPLTWQAQFAVHPILQLLDRRPLEAGDAIPDVQMFTTPAAADRTPAEQRALHLIQIAELAGEVRARLRDLPKSAQALAETTTQGFAEESPQPSRALRKGLSRADRLVRAASEMLAASPWSEPEQDVTRQLGALDAHQLLLTQANRTLHDFWAATRPEARPYFALVAERLLTAARQRYRPAQFERDQLQSAIAQAETALQNWQPLTAENRSFTSDETFVRHLVRWQGGPQIEHGVASVRIEKLGGQPVSLMDPNRTRSLGRRPVVTDQATELQHVIMTDESLDQSNALEAIAYYRGHERRAGFYLNAGANAAVARFQRPADVPPRVWVRQDTVEKNNVVFILDCSRSMRYRHNFEGTEQRRLQIATGTLTTILQKLDPETYRVGLLIYGGRSAWRREGNRIVLPSGQVHPAIDVDEVLPLSPILRADPRTGRRIDVRDDLYELLRQLNYRGDTPLYFSILRGIQSMENANPDGPRHIVVITDGVNSVYGNSEFPIPGFARSTSEDVKRALNNTNIKLHIVGFSAPPNHPEDRSEWEQRDRQAWEQQRDEIRGLATGGFHDVLAPEHLERALMESLQLKKFFVRRVGDPVPDARRFVDLGRSWQIGVDDPLGRYEVALAESPQVNTNVEVENGDWFELVYSPQRQRLEHQRFLRELQAEATVDRFFVGSHLPKRESARELSFMLSVQNGEARQFSRRPQAVWAEFQPVLPATRAESNAPGEPPRFVAYDLEFEPKHPVPMLRFRVAGWPELADERAVAQLWFAPANSYRPSAVHELNSDQIRPFELLNVRFNVETRPGRANEPSRLLIDEEHLESTVDFPLHVQLDPPPDTAHHVFLPESRRVQHVFVFQDRLPASLRLMVTTPRQIKRAWLHSGPLEVELPNR